MKAVRRRWIDKKALRMVCNLLMNLYHQKRLLENKAKLESL